MPEWQAAAALNDADRDRRTARLAEAHLEIEQRWHVELFQEAAVAGLGRDVSGDAMVEGAGPGLGEHSGCRGRDIAVEDDGRAAQPAGDDGAGDRRQLPAAEVAEHLERVVELAPMPGQCCSDHLDLELEPGTFDARAGAGPIGRRATEQCGADGGGRGRVGDAHLAHGHQVEIVVGSGEAQIEGLDAVGFGHRRPGREILGRPVEVDRQDVQLGAADPGQLVDRGTAGLRSSPPSAPSPRPGRRRRRGHATP